MSTSAQKKLSVLITEAGTFLGTELARAYLAEDTIVYGVSNTTLPGDLLINHNFTLLELDLSQPLPAYLPSFDLIFDFSILKNSKINLFSQMPAVPQQTENIISQLQDNTKLFIFSKIATNEDLYDYLTRSGSSLKRKLKLVLVGDLYGPAVKEQEGNELTNIIFQAIKSDKIILEDEGLRLIYPAYVTDVTESIIQIAKEPKDKEIYRFVSDQAKTSLTVSYELQDIARLVLGKELGLFFSGPQKQITHEPEIMVTADVIKKTDLREGLNKTLEYFNNNEQIEHPKKIPLANYHHPNPPTQREEQKPPHVTKRLPVFTLAYNFKARNVIAILIMLFLLTVTKTVLDFYLGATSLKAAKSQLESGDFKAARQKASNSQKSFHAAANKTIFIKSLNTLANSLETGSTAALYFTDGAEAFSKSIYDITQPGSTATQDKDAVSASFQKATSLSAYASAKLNSVSISPLNSSSEIAKKEFTDLSRLSQSAYELSNLLDDLTGASGSKKTYLVLLQNNTELRPGGGFIGNYATVEFNQGKLGDITVDDIYNIDGQLKEKIEPPKELKDKLGTTQLYLRDSNWSPDNTLNSQTERDLFKKETGKSVDGVITLDLSFVQEILESSGPIRLEDYKEDISAKNLFEKGEYYSEIGFFPGSTQKKDFFGALSKALIAKVLQTEKEDKNATSQIALIKAVRNALHGKHMMLSFDDPNLATYVATHGWNQPLPPLTFNPADDSFETRDFLTISEANLGANKVNRFIERKISYDMTIGRDADLVAKLKISYTNNSQADTWPGGKYTNFLRVYVPANSGLLEVRNGDVTDIKTVATQIQGFLTSFSTFVEVPIKSTKEIELTYRIPKNIKLETNPTYHVYFSKQPGTESDPLTFIFNLPQYLQIRSINGSEEVTGKQNVKTETDLEVDRQFTIEVKKN